MYLISLFGYVSVIDQALLRSDYLNAQKDYSVNVQSRVWNISASIYDVKQQEVSRCKQLGFASRYRFCTLTL